MKTCKIDLWDVYANTSYDNTIHAQCRCEDGILKSKNKHAILYNDKNNDDLQKWEGYLKANKFKIVKTNNVVDFKLQLKLVRDMTTSDDLIMIIITKNKNKSVSYFDREIYCEMEALKSKVAILMDNCYDKYFCKLRNIKTVFGLCKNDTEWLNVFLQELEFQEKVLNPIDVVKLRNDKFQDIKMLCHCPKFYIV